ncbi:FHA domain-containing protein [Ruminiclostridium sufflavum DSM 19573]|uniref:FHA domain-containing protein n=1 Tax=Ruminiclostridium sufflavum DSM 19573 TaxID=1121337 RepID=A0A318XS24_9FIRM|nr:FHA domain-containing protein [Ruminiclostridium sufflavum]PYG90324.1 FHA domain-containing protein [Ruminiclostridium sufflavum DSM 19573]
MNFNILDLSFLSVIFKVVLVIIVFLIIMQALKIMSKDVKRSTLKGGKNLGWKLRLDYSGDGGSFISGDIIPIGSRISIGRNQANQLLLPSQSVSAYHARIYFEDGRYMLEDLKSTNGTYINGVRADKKSLQPGDEIRISQTVLVVMDDE